MGLANTIAALIALTLTAAASAAHAARPAVCDNYDARGQTAEVDRDFGPRDFGGYLMIDSGLTVPADDLLPLCRYYDQQQHIIGVYAALGLPPELYSFITAPFVANRESAARDIARLGRMGLDGIYVGADVGAGVRLFGTSVKVLGIEAGLGTSGALAKLNVAGMTVVDAEVDGSFHMPFVWPVFAAQKGVDLYIFEVTARATAIAALGIEGSVSASRNGVSGTVRPYAGLDVGVSADVDVYFASAGVSGSLNLADVSLPTEGDFDGSAWNLAVNAAVDVLAGRIEVYGSLLGQRESVTLADFGGFELLNLELLNTGGRI